MEEFENRGLDIEELEDDALSFCDLRIDEQADVSPRHQYFSSPSRQFEFCSDLNNHNDLFAENIKFFGKFVDRSSEFTPPSIVRNQSIGKEFTETHSTKWKRSNSSFSNRSPVYKESEKKKRQVVLIGIARVPAKMELSEIRKRQSRRVPAPMFPKAIGDTPDGPGETNVWRNHWCLLRPLSYRSRLVSALAKASMCCLPLA